MSKFYVGIVGTSRSIIDRQVAREAILNSLEQIKSQIADDKQIVIVSGGGLVPMIALKIARQKN